MPTILKTVTIPEGEQRNPIAGSQYEFLPWAAALEFVLLHNSGAGGPVEATVFTGSDVLLEPSQIPEKAASAPVSFEDDTLIQDVVGGGERLGISLRNTHATEAAVVRVAVRITPAGV